MVLALLYACREVLAFDRWTTLGTLPKLTWKPTEGYVQMIVGLKEAPLHFHVNLEECI